MDFHRLVLRRIPQVNFAHGYKTNEYDMEFSQRPGVIEITCIEQGDVKRRWAGGEVQLLRAPCICVTIRSRACHMWSEAAVHRHATAAFQLDYEETAMTPDELRAFGKQFLPQGSREADVALLPEFVALDEQNTHLEKQIKTIIRNYSMPGEGRLLACSGYVLELLASLTEESARMLSGHDDRPPAERLYVGRAMAYIAARMNQKIAVDDIAGHLEISAGYLSRLFRSATGHSIVEYINHVKIEKVKELLAVQDASLKEAGENVGLFDENYVSRLFRRYTGMTAREYKMLRVKKDLDEESAKRQGESQ